MKKVAVIGAGPSGIAAIKNFKDQDFNVTAFERCFIVGRQFGLTIPELLTASNAAIFGATTAPAMAAAKGWHDQVTPGVLVGVLGYALGTFIGTALFQIW